MARMYPDSLPLSVITDPGRGAEARTYAALQSLPRRMRIFYSVPFLDRRGDRSFDGETDFVVLDPERGLLALEVKGGRIGREELSGTWTSTDRRGAVHEIKQPFDQARRGKRALLRKIQSLPRFSSRSIRAGHGVVLPDVRRSGRQHLGPDDDLDIVAFAEDLPRMGARIDTMFEATVPDGGPLDRADVDVLTDLFWPGVQLEVSVAELLGRADRRIVHLTEQQLVLLEHLARQRRALILGGAGSGKTALALHKARGLAGEGFRTLLTCFNRPLGDFLEAECASVDGLTAMSYHRLCRVLGDRAGLPPADLGGSSGFASLSDRLEQALDRLPDERFDALVVDEAQDMREGWWTALQLCLRDPDDGIIYAFGDDAQRLRHPDEPGPDQVTVSDAPELSQFLLPENLRNTVQIHELAMRFCPGIPPRCAGPEGPAVEFVRLAERGRLEREVGRVLHRLIREDGIGPQDIAILTGRSFARSGFGESPERVGTFGVTRRPDNAGRVLIETAKRFKGLDRPAVVLCELEDYLDNAALSTARSPGRACD